MFKTEEQKKDYLDDYKQKVKAITSIGNALKKGVINRPDTCELCGSKPTPRTIKWRDGRIVSRSEIVAHHYNGHENELDVWWICRSCNGKLKGKKYHSGKATRQEARARIEYLTNYNTVFGSLMKLKVHYSKDNSALCGRQNPKRNTSDVKRVTCKKCLILIKYHKHYK